MISLANEQGTVFYLRVEDPDPKESLERTVTLAQWGVTPAWWYKYLRHEIQIRPTDHTPWWTKTSDFVLPVTGALNTRILSHLREEFWEHFCVNNTAKEPPPFTPDPNFKPRDVTDLTPAERGKVLQTLVEAKLKTMEKPHTTAEAVIALTAHTAYYVIQRACGVHTGSLTHAIEGHELSPSNCIRLADYADRVPQWKVGWFLRMQSGINRMNVSQRGGHL